MSERLAGAAEALRVRDVIGLIVEATGLEAEIGEVCLVETGRNDEPVPAEVVGFRGDGTLLMPLGEMHGIGPGKPVAATGETFRVPVGEALLGSVVDGFGRPLDGSRLALPERRPAMASPPEPLGRSTPSPPAGSASGSASSPAPGSASPRCWG
jgi:flagellum-specific ATP synthase